MMTVKAWKQISDYLEEENDLEVSRGVVKLLELALSYYTNIRT